MLKENYFVLTGAMGAGKTTILNKIRERNLLCIDEPAREILKEQRLYNGDGVPEKNAGLFNHLMLSRMAFQYSKYISCNEPVIFDRGVPDIIAYAELLKTDYSESLAAAGEYRYNKHIFHFSGWKEIYTTDNERKADFETANNFGEKLKNVYTGLKYIIIDVPFLPVNERVDFILNSVKSIRKQGSV
ncbi:ATP-binding protein [soil metagenome]